ncbi:MAG TPA: sigma-54 dependent transcriptional regulator [Pyrinomonadaceae bacterium]|jgi:two-component system response regulator PilR (NtrC family)/two-component system response regulator HydG|nr:sigma-54 dependent transcriptional regulator [Pyrinomonadaceae bacterium]
MKTSPLILIAEDEDLMRAILLRLLEEAGYRAAAAASAEEALERFAAEDVAVTITDIRMTGMDGLALLDRIKDTDPEALVIVMTAYSSVDSAVAALRKGAYDYITKPFVNEDLLQSVKNALRQRELFRENRALRRELDRRYSFSEIIGTSPALQAVFRLVEKVASTNTNILVQGESGTGKELIARAIHHNSPRSERPFVAINCGALPETLLESELFGHVKGAFTGAVANKPGLFRSAEGGTVLLDEVGEISPAMQVRLLRTLQEHEVTPVGSSIAVPFDARIICATNRDLEKEVAEGRFREDLFYRLNVIEIHLPPLRERREDIPLLVRNFITRTAREQERDEKAIEAAALSALINYSWPGNVRELQNAIERAFTLSGDQIDLDSLPPRVRDAAGGQTTMRDPDGLRPTLEEIERRHIFETLASVNQDKARAANILGIDLSTLYRKLKRYDAV